MTDSTDYGQLETIDGQYRIHFERHLAHPPEKVWRALTEDEHLEAWFPTTIEGERTAGAALRFSFREHDLPSFEGVVHECEHAELLEFSWGPDRLRFELRPDGNGTILTLSDLVDRQESGKAARDSAGWHICLDQLAHDLGHHGDGTEKPWADNTGFEVINAHYVEQYPPEASTVGPPQEYYDTINAEK